MPDHELEPVSGVVRDVSFSPGRTDRLLTLRLDVDPGVDLCAGDPDSAITWDGVTVGAGQLVGMLLVAERVTVRLWPRSDRYGAALRAEFSDLR